eukprot:CAMPEP_0168761156 /NCGR_PEP_ID=MMETSP0724-20121128/23154_1 /TAXON_ID=265536 /ORGANISM="Amphiprora sp., Strain CCMP467" /LENGTH=628 /DNA_ID=CAMNT_0008810223 /DNA_START=21 /DNA_END=1904 /DNA_ORIENTATION=+
MTTDPGGGVPRVALEWFVLEAISSDVEMAQFSNVCELWRKIMIDTLVGRRCSGSPLLLTSFVRKLISLGENNNSNNGNDNKNKDGGTSFDEAFCLAWFAPEGLIQTWISPDDDSDGDDDDDDYGAGFMALATRAAQTYLFDDPMDSAKPKQPKALANNNKPQPNANAVLVTEEWRGFQSPADIFRHFGYTPAFLRSLIETLPYSNERDALLANEFQAYTTNAAVRGATIARADGYCFCHDGDDDSNNNDKNNSSQIANLRDKAQRQLYNEQEESDTERPGLFDIMHLEESKLAMRRSTRRKQKLRRSVLPRVLVSQQNHYDKGDEAADSPKKPTPPMSVQFLNGSRDHAVTMVTPLLDCGPQATPITLFCVAIATEDGCFLSGLHHKFELGHLYPEEALFEATEQSPICVATEDWDQGAIDSAMAQAFDAADDRQQGSVSSDDSTSRHTENSSCNCIFQHVQEKNSQLDTDPDSIARGTLGPGSWHVYTTIVYGEQYRIRVDGVEEPVTLSSISTTLDHNPMLDGLTLGSDHNFGVSLCCGQGSPGGQGAIAEVAVFRGALSPRDIETLEKRLMKKHCIPPLPTNFREQNDYGRRAQMLFCQGTGGPVPLHYLARNRRVAWKQHDPVS